MLYKIGDVSRILGISSDIMRYYEKKGIVKPIKGKDNDYRYYEAWDVNFLLECLWFMGYGYSTKEISELVSQYSYDDLCRSLRERETVMQENIERQQLLLTRLRQQSEFLEQKKDLVGTCRIEQSPDILRYLNRYNYIYDKSENLRRISKQWVKFLPFSRRSFHIEPDILRSGDCDFAWGFSLETQYAGPLGVSAEPPVVHIPSQKSLHYIFKEPGKDNFSPRLLQPMQDFAEENGLRFSGGAEGNLLCSVRENGVMTGYFEAWIPLDE